MAKILIIAKKITPTTVLLAKSLIEQQHIVILLTSQKSLEKSELKDINLPHLQLMEYFKTWSLLEGLKILPVLMTLQAQIVHFIVDEEQITLTERMLATFFKDLRSTVLATTVLKLELNLKTQKNLRKLLEESDIITGPSIDVLAQLRGMNTRNQKQIRGILSPLNIIDPLVFSANTESELPLVQLLQKVKIRPQDPQLFLLPFQQKKFQPDAKIFKIIQTLAANHFVLLWGSMNHWRPRERKEFSQWMKAAGLEKNWALSGELTFAEIKSLYQNSDYLFTAFQDFSADELTHFYLESLAFNVPLILDDKQSLIHSELWENKLNCWILDSKNKKKSLSSWLEKKYPPLKMSSEHNEKRKKELIDAPINEINRLYQKALSQVHS